MSTIRTNNLYVTGQLHRWLQWVSDIEDRNALSTDSVAEIMLRECILKKYPGIEQIEAEYWNARNDLHKETVNKLKQTTNEKNMGRTTDS